MSEQPDPSRATLPSEAQTEASAVDHYVGSLVGGKYRIMKVLGEGAMGVVLEGRHIELDQRVAIKFLRRDMLSRPDMVMRFDREAKTVARLHGEHVARVLDVGNEGGVPYIVMEFLQGCSLAQLLVQTPQLSIEEATSFAIEACAGLAEAHAAGIVHRDIKPDNLFLVVMPDGNRKVKVLDFGVSKVALTGSAFDSDAAKTDTMVGSPLYMSPEQVRAQQVDERSDLWSLGASLYEMLAGRPPFEARTLPQVCAMVLEAPIPDVRALRPDCPVELAQTIGRCLTRDRNARIASAGDLAMELAIHALPRAALVADTAVALARRTNQPGSEAPIESAPQERSNSLLELHLTGRTTSSALSRFSQSSLNVPSVSQTNATPAEKRPTAFPRVAAAALLLLLGGGGLLLRSSREVTPAADGASPARTVALPASALAAPDASAASAPSASAPSASASVASAPAPSASVASEPAVASALVPVRPAGPLNAPRPPATKAAPSRNDLDIRRTR